MRTALSKNIHKTAGKMEADLSEEMFMFAHECPSESVALPEPNGYMMVGLDRGYVHLRGTTIARRVGLK